MSACLPFLQIVFLSMPIVTTITNSSAWFRKSAAKVSFYHKWNDSFVNNAPNFESNTQYFIRFVEFKVSITQLQLFLVLGIFYLFFFLYTDILQSLKHVLRMVSIAENSHFNLCCAVLIFLQQCTVQNQQMPNVRLDYYSQLWLFCWFSIFIWLRLLSLHGSKFYTNGL